ncbi:MAG TPA: glycoside hydrolase family 28 protein [Verrucomicrobiae bacterium]|nr:glycoside hydrolase family 28 protein [Verrucomicrobiae bacterium]
MITKLPFAAAVFLAVVFQGSAMTNVRDFGASGDGQSFDTAAIQKAIDDRAAHGGGSVEFPAGTYLTKSIFLSNNITLQLDKDAIIKAGPNPDEWGDVAVSLIYGRGVTNIGLTGEGAVDGNGFQWWPPVKQAKKEGRPDPRRRPRLVIFTGCQKVLVRDVTLRNSPMFHLVPVDCDDVLIDHVTIQAPLDSPNTDAIDPSQSRHVRITRCHIDVGDDNVAIKSGYERQGRASCEDIVISDCVFLHGHGVSIGSETRGGVTNLLVEHCTFENTTSGIRIKSNRTRGGLVDGAVYRDLTMKNVRWPISIASYYPKLPNEDQAQPITANTPIYRNIQIINVTATSPDEAGFIVGLPEQNVSGVTLENVTITAPKGLTVRNADHIVLKNVQLKTQKGEPLITQNADVKTLP